MLFRKLLYFLFGLNLVISGKDNFNNYLHLEFSPYFIKTPYFTYNLVEAGILLKKNKWQLNVSPKVVDSVVGKQILGTTLAKYKMTGRFDNAFIHISSHCK